MKVSELDKHLQQLIDDGVRDAIFDFCEPLTLKYPVCIDLKPCIENMLDYIGNAMILYSGYQSEQYAPFAAAAKQMVRQEVESGRWASMPEDEKEAADVIARRCYDGISASRAAVEDPEKVYMVIGLYAYSTVVCGGKSDAWAFIRLFVYSWLIYYSDVLSMPAASMNAGPQCVS